jgi:SAM-dependent methyltransferase
MTTDCLRNRVKNIECLEIDPALANSLGHRLLNSNVHVQQGDATAMPYSDCLFSAVVSFTMLHHVPSLALQNQLFAEVYRVLRPGGVFAGVDSLPSTLMRIIHLNLLVSCLFASSWALGDSAFRRDVPLMVKLD